MNGICVWNDEKECQNVGPSVIKKKNKVYLFLFMRLCNIINILECNKMQMLLAWKKCIISFKQEDGCLVPISCVSLVCLLPLDKNAKVLQ